MSDNEQTHHDNENDYPINLIKLAKNPKHFGRMNDATSSAYIKGHCGDEMEFYLTINDKKIIEDVNFYTEGCLSTIICGSMTAQLAIGRSIYEALSISPKNVMDALEGLSDNHCHCTILAVSTLYKAIADYLLKP